MAIFSSRHAFLFLATAATLSLGACETMQTTADNVSTSVSDFSTRLASLTLDDINPFSTDPAEADAANAAAVMPAAGDASAAPVTVASAGCPHVQIVNDLKQLHQFTTPDTPDESASVSAVTMSVVSHNCTTDDNGMVLDMEVGFNGTLGVQGRSQSSEKPSFSYPYFVAVTNAQGSILAKEIFAATLTYDNASDTVAQSETIRQVMPAGGETGSYRVLVGFQLTPQELAYNRALPPVISAEFAAQVEPAAGEQSAAPIAQPAAMNSIATGPVANDNSASPGPVTLTPQDFAK